MTKKAKNSRMKKMKASYGNAVAFVTKVPNDILSLGFRVALAGMFWKSMQTKIVNGELFNIQQFFFFETRYGDFSNIPLLTGKPLAYATVTAETILPVLLLMGLATRFTALALIAMTVVIQIFVYPKAWDSHLLWVMTLLFIFSRGAGKFSVDHLITSK